MSNAARKAESEHEAVRKAVVRAEIADWYERDPDEADVSGQFTVYHFQLDALSKSAREYAEQNGVGVDEFRDGPLEQARCLVRRLHNAFIDDQWETEAERARRDPTKRLNFWRHERNPLAFVATKQIPYIDRAWVESETGHYLNIPFRSAALDRLLVDVLIGMELYAFANEMLNEPKPLLGPPQSPMNLRHPIRVFFVGQFSNALFYLGGAALSVCAGSVGWIGESWSIGIAIALVCFFLLALVLALSQCLSIGAIVQSSSATCARNWMRLRVCTSNLVRAGQSAHATFASLRNKRRRKAWFGLVRFLRC